MDIIDELKKINIITKHNKINNNNKKILASYPNILDMLIENTKFLIGEDISVKERITCLLNGITTQQLCKKCSKPLRHKINKNEYPLYCSVKCSKNDAIVREKTKNTCIERYGVEHPMQAAPIRNKVAQTIKNFSDDKKSDIRRRIENTCLSRYGVDNASKHEDTKAKQKQTNIEKYGYVSASQHPAVKAKISHNHTKNVIGFINNPHYLSNENKTKTLKQISLDLGVSHSIVSTRFKDFNIPVQLHTTSHVHNEIVSFLRSLNINNIVENNRTILSGKEIDILLPDYNIGIELDGIYWHSEIVGNKDKHYHINKTEKAKEQNITLLHIYDIEWLFNRNIVESRLKSKLNINETIYARKCSITEISNEVALQFLNETHIQGMINGSVRYGLFYNNEIVACMIFSKVRFGKQYQYELLRYCSKLHVNVVGGAGKLHARFIKDINPRSIVSYSDKRWNTGTLYERIGYHFSHTTLPNFKYIKNGILYNRLEFQKHKLKNKLTTFSPDLTAWENMVNNGYDRIWDCGNDVWVWRNNS